MFRLSACKDAGFYVTEQIKKDNAIRQEWNKIADVALVVGISDKKIKAIRKNEITTKIQHSMQM
ncbi:hypothetical protein, partial [Parabacteroides goldsteinii]|uniref:hypothetical protein n=1 Tax=Parabacteroides goldsteinii TaxID=328812 RepID=UPI0025B687A5